MPSAAASARRPRGSVGRRVLDCPAWQAASGTRTSPPSARSPRSTRSSASTSQLRNAGGGNLKGLCPFHDEKTPSFHVAPPRGSSTASAASRAATSFAFVQRIEHLELHRGRRAARRPGGHPAALRRGRQRPARTRAGHASPAGRGATSAAAEFYAEQLAHARGAARARVPDRARLRRRGRRALRLRIRPRRLGRADQAPARARVLARRADRRPGWPGRVSAARHRPVPPPPALADPRRGGDVVGFGARRLFDDDRHRGQVPQHPETPIYKKSQVLYGARPGQAGDRPRSTGRSSSRATPT